MDGIRIKANSPAAATTGLLKTNMLSKSIFSIPKADRLCQGPELEETPVDVRYVWIAYSNRPPGLPVAVADTAKELAAIIGVSCSTVRGCWMRYQRGKCLRTRYHKVLLPQENTGYTKERSSNG